MKVYRASRIDPGPGWPGTLVVDVHEDRDGIRAVYPLGPRVDLRNHSPTGLECGYGGSGAAQLALALLADYFGPHGVAHALYLYQAYKRDVVARLPRDGGWEVTADELAAWLRQRGEDAVN